MNVKTPDHSALTLVEVLVLMAMVVLLVLVFLPPLTPARSAAPGINCRNNLKQVGLAFDIWAGDNGDQYPMSVSMINGGTKEWLASGLAWPHFLVISNELNTPKVLSCPGDTKRAMATNWCGFDNNSLSYFVGVDAAPNHPEMLLTGDRQITRDGALLLPGLRSLSANQNLGWSEQSHRDYGPLRPNRPRKGHVAMAGLDASHVGDVKAVDGRGLRKLLANSGLATNRFVIA
jgi:competence protein ComGC